MAATQVLGTKPTIIRGGTPEKLPKCVWGTPTALVSLSASPFTDRDAAEQTVSQLKDFGGTPVEGLGTLAFFSDSPDGTVVRWSTEDGVVVSLTTATGRRADRAPLVALAKAAASSFA